MARCLCLLGFLLSLLWSGVALGQVIKGGAETATFEPGDLTLYQEDLSGTPIGAQVEGWKIIAGTYEVAEFQDKRWFRPLTIGTHILRTLRFPENFSVEFTAYFFERGQPRLRVFLHTEEEVKRRITDYGPAQVFLIVGRGHETDLFHLRKRSREDYEDVAQRGGFPPNRPHRIALQVRDGQLALFFDGERVATTPFQPEAPITAISFHFGCVFEAADPPYKDRPALLNGIRIAAYTGHALKPTGGVRLFWALPVKQDSLPPFFRTEKTKTFTNNAVTDALKKRYGWQEATLVVIEHPNPFASGEVWVRMDEAQGKELIARLKEAAEVVRAQGGGLLILGEGGDGQTERERKLLSSFRAFAFAAWLAQNGLGDLVNLMKAATTVGICEGILCRFGIAVGGYEGIP